MPPQAVRDRHQPMQRENNREVGGRGGRHPKKSRRTREKRIVELKNGEGAKRKRGLITSYLLYGFRKENLNWEVIGEGSLSWTSKDKIGRPEWKKRH